jgi:hypothetical protein
MRDELGTETPAGIIRAHADRKAEAIVLEY